MAAVRSEEGDLVMLEHDKLRKLAILLYKQEEKLMDRVTSEAERMKYLDNCNKCYEGAIKLMDGSQELVQKKSSSELDVVNIVEDIHKYIKYFLNMSMQCIRNGSLRATCVSKIEAHFADLVKLVEELEPADGAGIRRLAEEVTLYKEYMWMYTNKCRSGSARALSKGFSSVVKETGMKFPDLITRHKNKLGFEGEFEELEEADKLKVYHNIMEESGRAEIPKIEIVSGSLGLAVLVTAAALIVFDIFEAEYKLEAIVRNTLETVSEIGAFVVQLAVESTVSATVAEFEIGGILVVAGSGFIAGALAGLIFMAASGALIDWIFHSGGKVEPHMVGMQFRKLNVPNGMEIALELAHN